MAEAKLRLKRRLLRVAVGCSAGALLAAGVFGRYLFSDYFPPMEKYAKPDPYHIYEQDPRHWRNKPGFSFTLEQAIQDRREQQRDMSAVHLLSVYKKLGYALGETVFAINQAGFKGPELDPSLSRPRILMLGDSCTFGSLFDRYSYPRVVERTLAERNLNFEVINAGVEGFSPYNLLHEMPTYLALAPKVVTVYIGWNALYRQSLVLGANDSDSIESYFQSLYRRAGENLYLLLFGERRYALWQYSKVRVSDKDDPALRVLEHYAPPALADVEEVILNFKTINAKVVLMTLPGIYLTDEEPTALAVLKGHLPPYTSNPYVLAKITERYNEGLRDLARKHELQLIDLDRWGRTALAPRDRTFIDSVHLMEEEQEKMGIFITAELFPSNQR